MCMGGGGVNLEDGLSAHAVGEVHGHPPVEAPGAEEGLVQHVCGENSD